MTRFAIDTDVALRIIAEGRAVPAHHQLVAPSSLRSAVLARLYADVREGRLDEAEGRRRLEALASLRVRLLADRVSRATAWKIARELDWPDVGPAEYLAVARLQADAIVTTDPLLMGAAKTVIPLAAYEQLFE